VRRLHATRAFGALLGLLCASTGCSLTADLDSLMSGSGAPEVEGSSADAGSWELESGVGDECHVDSCNTTPSATTNAENPDRNSTAAHDAASATPSAGDAGPPTDTQSPAPFGGDSTDGDAAHDATSAPRGAASRGESTSTLEETTSSADIDTCTGNSSCAFEAELLHRYSFANVTTSIADAVGDADGAVVGTATENAGSFVFDGETYIELPTEVLSGRENVTIEVWFTSYTTRNWERIFDAGESEDGSGESYLFLTSQSASANGTMRVTFRPDGETETSVNSAEATSDNLPTHVAVVFDGSENELRLYHDGELSASGTTQGSLQDVNVANVWLGRSLFEGDPLFEGELDELRIYDGVLSAAHVKASFDAGPDAPAP
jgi:arabinan endo-1,5-alpha-L-arabinosidase